MRIVQAVLAVVVVALALVVELGAARAQPTAQDKAAAEAAFRQGRDLMAKGEYAAACMAFRSSQQIDPQLGTQYNLGLCYEKGGMLASAWGELTDLAARDTNAARKKDAGERAKKLEPRLVKLLIVVREMRPGLTVVRDGNDVTPIVGVATPVDPGTSVLEAEAPGFEKFSLETTLIGEGTTVTVEIPPLVARPEPPPDEPPSPDDCVVLPPPAVRQIDLDRGKGRRRLGLVVGVVGFGALAAGATFGAMANSANQDARDACGGDVSDCRGDLARAEELVASARTRGTISTIGFGVGAAAVVAGAVLYVAAPAKLRPAETTTLVPTAGRSHVGLALAGRF
jgi:hypothetical protein